MDYLLGRFAEQAIDSMNADEISVLERLIEMQDPEIELSVYEGYSLGDKDLDTLIALIREFHDFPGAGR
ncbi:hypothetical protein AUC68_07580 [Methyloceanibacter methanicus]|uniref:FAD assembly factor SdhE n=2 Tax=Methyloceanibacter methanicus TaxID=1774968 RepID=A0A1E3VZP4_9HYPH|nr:hypothetical protein AUC68_07580 [Methyloceanibacter methanicus]